nr:ABC transporter ATP-binding protein [Kineosporia mesophila]
MALQEINLVVPRSEFLAVTGASGSGKSTMLNVLGLLDPPSSGEYQVNGQDITMLRAREVDQLRSRLFGFVFQASHMLPERTVAANVALPLRIAGVPRSTRPGRVWKSLERVGLVQRAQARASSLSGGERQRAAIARALVNEPEVLLADEPTGNLDAENAERVMTIFDELRQAGLTLVMITHNQELAERADRQVVLSDGRLLA